MSPLGLLPAAAVLSLAIPANINAQSFEVTNAQKEIAGSSTTVSGGGSSNNFGSPSLGDFAVFDVSDTNGNDYADLKVTYAADNGIVGNNIMIARTVDSQGLVDTGTISVLIEAGSGGGTADLRFDWYTPGSFDGGLEQSGASIINTGQINYTTFDIDFRQEVSILESETASYMVNGTTELVDTAAGGSIFFRDGGADSSFDDPETAFAFLSRSGTQTKTITMGKQSSGGNALFMFEFRDPSDNVTFTNPQTTVVPEPRSFALIAGVLGLTSVVLRRRRA